MQAVCCPPYGQPSDQRVNIYIQEGMGLAPRDLEIWQYTVNVHVEVVQGSRYTVLRRL